MVKIKRIRNQTGKDFVRKYHYAVICPPITKLSIGLYKDNKLMGVAMWGYGTRPYHTIKKLFPSLSVNDYFELNRLCVHDDMPKNTESQFIKKCIDYIKKNYEIKVLFSWADGLRGKVGYVYQASNFYHGGKILSDFYITKDGEVVHPRFLITRYGRRDMKFAFKKGLNKIRGYQFRYVKFLCSHKERKNLLKESPFEWSFNYPKKKDLTWTIIAEEGSRESHQIPILKGAGQFRHSAFKDKKQKTLYDIRTY